ncbi:hypothetical protein C8P64_2755 [Christiangramia gaetbulicola]|uniref:Uncharacterized protein n=1 Tax=Christiangramia gaetbulicola TaxID=703340 RepID=A0A2T6AEU5_9FLAO|nr:hypothetical protein C8P64_2755 [Christiangramia gaetbulicola]
MNERDLRTHNMEDFIFSQDGYHHVFNENIDSLL